MRVLYVQYTDPGAYPPLVRGAQLLAESGARVLMLGTRVRGLDALSVTTVNAIGVRLLEAPREGWRLKAHYARYAAWVAREAAAWRPDWIYASDVLAAPIALMLRAITGARLAYHEHDAPSLDHVSWTMRRCLAARRHLAREAAIVVAPNAARAARLSRDVAGGRAVHTVWNCPRRPSPPVRPRERGGDDQALHVVFRGSVNPDRLPTTVIDAMARAGERVVLDIVGYETAGSRGYIRDLSGRAGELGIGERVRALGTLPEGELAEVCGRSDLGLALMPVASVDENMAHMAGASNKLFEYLSCGVTPLVTDLPDWRSAFVEPGYALSCRPDTADSIQQAFEWAASHRSELRAIAERGMTRLQDDWNYETQFAPIIRAMASSDGEAVAASGDEGVRCAS